MKNCVHLFDVQRHWLVESQAVNIPVDDSSTVFFPRHKVEVVKLCDMLFSLVRDKSLYETFRCEMVQKIWHAD